MTFPPVFDGLTSPPHLRRLPALAIPLLAFLAFVAAGLVGLYRYVDSYWLYRGFPPPHDPAYVTQAGSFQTLYVRSQAVGGRRQRVVVYLPPGYASSAPQRYPVLYLLHGFPGDPEGFVRTIRVGVVEDALLAKHRLKPTILVMPMGSTGVFTDKEWANGVHPGNAWETFLARDVVRAVDRRYRTIATGAARGLAGLSEGGYASLNIGLHHPGEFRVLESWSGYQQADDVKSVFGGRPSLLARNSPLVTLRPAARTLRSDGAFIWFYTGSKDSLRHENRLFAAELDRLRVAHLFFVVEGGHTWALWRRNAWQALAVASAHLAHG
ncbi:MAG TPA: alpha/beta hydrolase-fold protein [Gaiellaceae bacterium]|nr:alpha/beta hydrolase-fold protein [Gaiellaceae bacterium]